MGWFYSNGSTPQPISYAGAGYLSDPYNVGFQTWYLFIYGDKTIQRRSTKQIIAATSSNHA